ncbi:sodium-coupled monocarboxylate transporter 2-like [Ctenocephalides felis]|uniref:sodium-coupled monocarboxylate transporter 2-like n=1 Tax=Ctenocephalides felis TaxID=7515 RepID=UPI000E6E340B|nr:sodium-coupled monocarboxylate transporter 2-like [Ctenocephalides felis]
MLALSTLIGVWFGFFSKTKQDSTADYLMGGKSMGTFPIAMSLIASHISGITLLAVPTEMYTQGTQYWISCISGPICMIIIAYVYLPVFYGLQLTSAYEYLERRFDRSARKMASLIFALSLILFLPIVIYVPAIAFSQVTGVNIHAVTLTLLVICVFYTSFGGMRAVVWTDTLQSIVTCGAMFAVVWIGVADVGGIAEVFRRADEGGRIIFFNMNPSIYQRTSFWSVSLGLTTMWLSNLGVSQSCIQRFLSVPTLKDARWSIIYFTIGLVLTKSISCFTGLLMYAHYKDCDPLSTGDVKKADQMLPYYVHDVAGYIPGLSGLFVAGVFSAALSTISSGLNTLSGTLYEDFIKEWLPVTTSEKTASNIMKLTVVVIGGICLGLVFVVEQLGSVMHLVISVTGVTAGTLLGMFTLGILFPKANTKGVLVGAAASLILVSWMVSGAQINIAQGNLKFPYLNMSTEGCPEGKNTTVNSVWKTQHHDGHSNDEVIAPYRIGFMYYSMIGAWLVIAIGYPVSYFTGGHGYLDKMLLAPQVRRWALEQKSAEYDTFEKANSKMQVLTKLDDEDPKYQMKNIT